jgi:hypothetical protein
MTEVTPVETTRRAFAKITESLEDTTLVAAEGQASPNLSAARQSSDCLINALEACLARLQRLRRRLG